MGTHASQLSARGATRREEEMEGSMGAADPPHEETWDGLQALQEEVDILLRKTIQCDGKEWND